MSHKFHKLTLLASLVGLLLAACGAAPAQSWSGLALSADNSTIYIAGNTHVYALSTDGKNTLQWQQPSSSGGGNILSVLFGGGDSSSTSANTSVNLTPVFADPAIAGDLLIVPSYNKSVYGLNIKDGSQKWVFSQSADRLIAPAVVHDTTIYIASADNNLYALNLDGSLKWQFKTDNSLWGAPVATDTVVYVPSMDHNLYALNLDGSLKWEVTLNGALADSPTLSKDGKIIYVGSLSDTLYALNAEDGSQLWTVKADGWVWTTPLIDKDTLYFGDLDGSVFACDAATGTVKWKASVGGAVRGTPAISDTTLLIAVDEGTMHALNTSDGSQKWVHEVDDRNADRLLSNLVVIADKVLVVPISADQLVYALKIADGSLAWSFKPS